jgi:hypothetical protein
MRTSVLILFLFIWHALIAADASAFRNEPDGFQDRNWGRTVDSLFSKDEYVGFNIDDKSSKYQVLSDKITLETEGVKLYGIVYSFYSGMFWKVELEARLLQAAKLLNLFIEKYGEPSSNVQISEFSREYTWSGVVTDIILTTSLNYYDRKTADIATATIYNRKMKSAIDADVDYAVVERKLNIDSVDGFRGRKWGSGFVKGVTYLPLEQEPYFEYLIQGDDMMFEGVNAQEIRYRFYNNKALQKVDLYFNGKQNYLNLKEACFKLFGHTSRYENGEIKWIGKKTTVSLTLVIDVNGIWLSRLSYHGFGSQ